MRLVFLVLLAGSLLAQPQNPPVVAFDSDPDFLKLPADMNFGEVLGIAINSKGRIAVVNHPGTYGGPLYGAASTQILEFDATGKFLREIGRGVYGLGYAHSIRFDKYDNMWVADKGTNSVIRFNSAGRVTMNLGRREEGPDEHHYVELARGDKPPVAIDGYFHGATDIAFDSDDNIYITDGYVNSRVAKLDKHGNWIKSWGTRGRETGQFNLPHNIATDRQNNVYVADRNNRRIQVFNTEGEYLRSIVLNVPYDKSRHPVLGNAFPNMPDTTQPWGLCISNTPTQYIYTADQEPGRIYKLTLDGKIVAMFGRSGHEVGEFNWVHAIACPSENTIYIADMNNWRVQKVTLHPEKTK